MTDFQPEAGQLNLILGPMFSGKTTALLHEITTLADVGLNVLYINHADDNRKTSAQSKNVTTHHTQFSDTSDKVTTTSTLVLNDVNISEYDVIGVDEGQFFESPDLENTIRNWVVDQSKIVYLASLNGNFKAESFGHVKELICLASSINMRAAKCMICMKQNSPYPRFNMVDAPFTGKISGDHDQIKDAGGSDKYVALCLKCHKDLSH